MSATTVLLLMLCTPVAIGLFLLLMERLEAALFPASASSVAGDDGQQEQPAAVELVPPLGDVVVMPEEAA